MSFANTYKSTRPPTSNPCDACKRVLECDQICIARARWWDVAIKRLTSKLQLIRETVPEWKRQLKFYVFCGCDKNDKYDLEFWKNDIRNLFERISILSRFNAKPYIMRFEKVYDSEFSTFYSSVASWCNQPHMFKTFSFRLFCKCKGMRRNGYTKYKRDIDGYLKDIGIKGSDWREMERVEALFPDIAKQYFD